MSERQERRVRQRHLKKKPESYHLGATSYPQPILSIEVEHLNRSDPLRIRNIWADSDKQTAAELQSK